MINNNNNNNYILISQPAVFVLAGAKKKFKKNKNNNNNNNRFRKWKEKINIYKSLLLLRSTKSTMQILLMLQLQKCDDQGGALSGGAE